jgi:hypothetical protein
MTRYHTTNDAQLLPEELSQEQNSFIPALGPAPSEQKAICDNMHASGLTPQQNEPVPWPNMGPPLSEYTTKGLFTMAFPSLFPLSLADPSLCRLRKIELYEWARHLMHYRDS